MKNFHHLTLENPTDFQRSFLGVVCSSNRNHMGMGQKPGSPGEPQNSWDLWMFIPLKMVLIGFAAAPHAFFAGPRRSSQTKVAIGLNLKSSKLATKRHGGY